MRLLIFLLGIGFAISINAMVLRDLVSPVNPIQSIQFLEDRDSRLTFEDIQKSAVQAQFKPIKSSGNEINFGYSNSTYWLRIPLSKTPNLSDAWILELPYFGLSQITFYSPENPPIKTGSAESIESRPIFFRFYAFPLTLTDAEQNFYLQVRSNQPVSIPLNVWARQAFIKHVQLDTVFQALYYGGIGVLAIFNLFLYLYLRDRAYIFYSIFALFIGFGIFAGNGFGRLLLWTDMPRWDDISQAVLLGFASGSALLFVSEFLKIKTFSIAIFRIFIGLASGLFLISIGLFIFSVLNWPTSFYFMLLPGLAIPSTLLSIYAGYKSWIIGHNSAKFFLLAWGVLAIGGLVASLRMFDLIPSNPWTSYALQISSAVEMILLAFALAGRIQDERDLRESAQQESMRSQERLVQSLKASEERLENQVTMRTNDLNILLASEKGLREQYIRFGSMISHEFRNPLGIIETQVALLSRDGIDPTAMRRVSVIGSATHRLAMLFDRWLQGDRLENGVDQARPQVIQLNKWINNLVQVCRTYHTSHQLIFETESTECILIADEKMLEVVLLNLIDNACKFSAHDTVVTIRIRHSDSMIGISVADRGIGISESDQSAIFNEFVQLNPRKDVRGFGLGLAFVKKVVEFHRGNIEITSRVGVGSEFTAWFPERPVVDVAKEL